jgi:hypothetical protein
VTKQTDLFLQLVKKPGGKVLFLKVPLLRRSAGEKLGQKMQARTIFLVVRDATTHAQTSISLRRLQEENLNLKSSYLLDSRRQLNRERMKSFMENPQLFSELVKNLMGLSWLIVLIGEIHNKPTQMSR